MLITRVNKKCFALLCVLTCLLPQISFSQSGNCDPVTPFVAVDLTGSIDSIWTSLPLTRDGTCCITSNNCIEFEVILDPGSVAINFDVVSGALPGILEYQVNCGPVTPVGTPLCISGPGPHVITFCKVGNNANAYQISAMPAVAVSADDTTTTTCPSIISTTGMELTNISWTSVFPGATGTYDNYLSCTANCDSTTVSPDTAAPPYIDYQICGIPIAAVCYPPGFYCDTIRVHFFDSTTVVLGPDPADFCQGDQISLIATIVNAPLPITYQWLDPVGNAISDSLSITGILPGTYTFEMMTGFDPGCTAQQETIVANFVPPPVVNAGPDVTICPTNPSFSLNGVITNANGGQWSAGGGTFFPNDSSLTAVYTATPAEVLAGSFYVYLTSTGHAPCYPIVDSILVTVTDTVMIIPTVPDFVCYQELGNISVTVTGGTGPYTYQWSTGATTDNINIGTGTYSVTVTDNSEYGCSATTNVTLTENPQIFVNIPSQNLIACDSMATVTVSATGGGGTGNFTYQWNTGAVTPTVNLFTGSYTITAIDTFGCTATDVVNIISSNSVLDVNISPIDTVCFGESTLINAVGTGGFAPYTFTWNNGILGPTNFGSAGNYCVTVTDTAGCINVECATVYEFDSLNVSLQQPGLVCNGGMSNITTLATGGNSPYTFNWSNGDNTQTVNVPAGAYTVNVTDSNTPACTGQATVLVPEAPPLLVSFQVQDVSCFGGNDGIVTAVPSGGVAPYTYQWSTGSFDSTVTGLSANTVYSILITDNLNCQTTATVTVNEPPQLVVNSSSTPVSCFGGSDGTTNAVVTGGVQPYAYEWFQTPGISIGQLTQQATNLSIGTYYAIITDDNNCQVVSQSQNISEPTAIQIALNTTSPICSNACDGNIAANVSGGNGQYTYQWNDPLGQTALTAINLCGGTFILNVTDINGCMAADTAVLINPTPLLVDTSSTNSICGQNTGSGCVIATGGTAPYTFLWPTGDMTNCAQNLFGGTYLVSVTDASGCQAFGIVNIQDDNGPVIAVNNTTGVNCFGDCNGTATVGIQGNPTVPYTVQWDPAANNQVTPTATNLCSGTYGVSLTDSSGCVSSTIVTITGPSPLVSNPLLTPIVCADSCDGAAIAIVSGGSQPYSYNWLNSSNTTISNTVAATNLCFGNYSLITTDDNGCIVNSNFTLTNPTPNVATAVVTNVNCFGNCNGQITINPSGVAPFTYQWDVLAGSQTTQTAVNLCAGTYTCTVTDNNGCQNDVIATVVEPPALTLNFVNLNHVSCKSLCDGSVEGVPVGGLAPYTYSWSNGFTGSNASGLCAGNYCLTITDANGCQYTDCIAITEPFEIELTVNSINVTCNSYCNGTANALINGGTPPYSIIWNSPGQPNTIAVNNLCAGIYTCSVTDANGCTATANAIITEPPAINMVVLSTQQANCGLSNGSICVSASGGNGNLSYQWSDPLLQQTNCLVNVSANCYTVSITDANNCQTDSIICISDINGPVASIVNSTDITCNGVADGTLTAQFNGGALPVTSEWTDTSGAIIATNTLIVSNLSPGCYTYTVTDATGCVSSTVGCVNEPQVLSGIISQLQHPSCFNLCDGSGTVIAAGGIAPYTYLWSGGNTPNQVSNTSLCDGINTITIQDDNNCQIIIDTTLIQPGEISLQTADTIHVSCFGDCTGELDITITGGTGAYLYNWIPNVASGALATNLCAGPYSVDVSDINGCNTQFNFTITSPQDLTLSVNQTNSTCGNCNASTTTIVSGGVQPYTYQWQSGQTTPTVNGALCAGLNNIVVTDNNGCTAQQNITIIEEPSPVIDSISVVEPLCNGSADGQATVYASSGIGNYTYDWGPNANSQTSVTAIALGSDNYCVTVTDVNNCQATACTWIDEPFPIVPLVFEADTLCSGQSTNVWGTSQGGTTPYTINWVNPGLNGPGPHPVAPNGTTTYCLNVTDVNGCQSPNACIDVVGVPPLSINISPASTFCLGSTITLDANFNGGLGADYAVSWYRDQLYGPNVTSQINGLNTTANISPTDSIWYYVIVDDGCSIIAVDSVFIPVNDIPSADLILIDKIGCVPLTTTASITSPTAVVYNYDFDCNGETDISSSNSTASYTYTQPGTYNFCLTVIDNNGCENTIYSPDNITAWPVPIANFSVSPTVTDIYNSTIEFTDHSDENTVNTWLIEDKILSGPINTTISAQNSNQTSGTYSNMSHTFLTVNTHAVTLIVSNEFACKDSITKLITIQEETGIFAPNAITPDDDVNDIFNVVGTGLDQYNFRLSIYNRWGELIFETFDIDEGWDGTYNNYRVPIGVYVWKVVTKDLNDEQISHVGHVTVLR